MLDQDDNNLVVFLASGGAGCSLDSSPKKNWVERGGGLPNYICKIAKAVMKSGKSKSSAIAIAVSRVKKWAAGGDDVDADTRAKAAKAVAQWEALKAKSKSKKIVKATREDGSEYLQLSNVGSFNTDIVRKTWNDEQEEKRRALRHELGDRYMDEPVPYSYIRELWSDFVIVEVDGVGGLSGKLAKVPYGVTDGKVYFGEPVEVTQEYVEVDDDYELTELEAALLGDVLVLSRSHTSYLEIITEMAKKK